MNHPLEKADILLASMHEKEKAIVPAFKDKFLANVIVAKQFDTDYFGTFTGERERVASQYETLIEKVKSACQQYSFRYGLASEGSFGMHSSMPFLPTDYEMIVFYDQQQNHCIVEANLSCKTNYSHLALKQNESYDDFLKKVGFGQHGLIVRDLSNKKVIAKGITEINNLRNCIKQGFLQSDFLQLETDMRAMFNPMRMAVIKELAYQLTERLAQYCPSCQLYGFGKKGIDGVLPCVDCHAPSTLYALKVLECETCGYHEKMPRADGLYYAEAQYCIACNP